MVCFREVATASHLSGSIPAVQSGDRPLRTPTYSRAPRISVSGELAAIVGCGLNFHGTTPNVFVFYGISHVVPDGSPEAPRTRIANPWPSAGIDADLGNGPDA